MFLENAIISSLRGSPSPDRGGLSPFYDSHTSTNDPWPSSPWPLYVPRSWRSRAAASCSLWGPTMWSRALGPQALMRYPPGAQPSQQEHFPAGWQRLGCNRTQFVYEWKPLQAPVTVQNSLQYVCWQWATDIKMSVIASSCKQVGENYNYKCGNIPQVVVLS